VRNVYLGYTLRNVFGLPGLNALASGVWRASASARRVSSAPRQVISARVDGVVFTWIGIRLLTYDKVFDISIKLAVQVAISTIERDEKMQLPLAEDVSPNTHSSMA
jgi:hypothetical protein